MKDQEPIHPFAIVPVEVFMDTRLTLETMRVLCTLFSFRNKITGLTFPTREKISLRCGMHPSNISAATTKLVELGWLIKTGKGGFGKPTSYDITVPEVVNEFAKLHQERSDARELEKKGNRVAEQATVSQSATVAQQATCENSPTGYSTLAQQAIRKASPTGYTQETDQLTDQVTDKKATHTPEPKTPVCVPPIPVKPGKAGSCCRVMIESGIQGCNPCNPTLLALLQAGANEEEFAYAAREATSRGNTKFNYVIGIVKKQREDAANLNLHKGRMPNKQEKFDPVAYVNRFAKKGSEYDETVIEHRPADER